MTSLVLSVLIVMPESAFFITTVAKKWTNEKECQKKIQRYSKIFISVMLTKSEHNNITILARYFLARISIGSFVIKLVFGNSFPRNQSFVSYEITCKDMI